MFPRGLDEIRKEYGDPRGFLRTDGTVHASWEQVTLGTCVLPTSLTLGWDHEIEITRIRCHKKLVVPLGGVFNEIFNKGWWPLLKTFDGCYSWRAKRNGSKLSTHCWGIAVDFNAQTNQLGQKGDMPPEIVQTFMKHGWEWGGNWLAQPDPMHFQACMGY